MGNAYHLWDVQTQKQVVLLKGHTDGEVNSIAFSPDEKWLASGRDGAVLLWKVNIQVPARPAKSMEK